MVCEAIDRLSEIACEAAVIEEVRVLTETARIAFSDPGELFDDDGNLLSIKEMPAHVRAAIASIEVEEKRVEIDGEKAVRAVVKKVKLWDENSASERLFKHRGLYEQDHAQRNGLFNGVPVEIVQQIQERLRALVRPDVAGPAAPGNPDRFTH